jgi:dihydroxyacetone kinase-like predicted kinase
MMNVDFEAPDAQSIVDAMTESIPTVATAQITYAARNSDFDGFDIKEGDYLALMEGKLFGTDASLNVLLEQLAQTAVEREASFISLYYGEDVAEEDAQKAAEVFQTACPDAEIALLAGDQPVYYYIISLE